MPDASPRVSVDHVDQFGDGVLAVADDVCRNPFRDRDHVATDHQNAVVLAPVEALDDDPSIARLLLGVVEGPLHLVGIAQVQLNPPAVVSVRRFQDHWVADAFGQPHGLLCCTHGLGMWHGQTGRTEQPRREFLVRGDVHGQSAGL